MKQMINKGISFGLGFIGVLFISGITYATYSQLSDVTSGNTLTSTMWNQMIDNQDNSNSRLNNLESKSTFGGVFSVTASTAASTPANIRKIIPFDTKQIDTDNFFNTSTYRFQPTKAGYYRVNLNLNIGMTGIVEGFTLAGAIFKNGGIHRISYSLINYTSTFTDTINVSDVIYFNGTTDYIDGRFQTNYGTPSNSVYTSMSGKFIRP